MIFRQLFEPATSTYTYLVACDRTGQAVLIDPVLETIERDLAMIQKLGLRLAYTLETHIHADHLTGARKARSLVGSRIAAPAMDALSCVDEGLPHPRRIDLAVPGNRPCGECPPEVPGELRRWCEANDQG